MGRPNVGKSTLLNQLVGQKIAIVSDTPQTTRNRILGILTLPDAQVLFLDTPGIHKPQHKLGEYMVNSARSALREVDLILFVSDVSESVGPGERFILDMLKDEKTPVVLVLNKVDLLPKEKLLPIIRSCSMFQGIQVLLTIRKLTRQQHYLFIILTVRLWTNWAIIMNSFSFPTETKLRSKLKPLTARLKRF